MRRRALAAGGVLLAIAILLWAWVPPPLPLEDDAHWAAELVVPEGAAVQLHLSAVPFSGQRAVHPFFVVRGEDQALHRYEVWQSPGERGSHVWVDENAPGFTMDTGTVLWAQVQGAQAQGVIEVLQSAYPCADRYTLLPGPNSNTYAAWVLEQSGWDVALPRQSLGKAWGCRPR